MDVIDWELGVWRKDSGSWYPVISRCRSGSACSAPCVGRRGSQKGPRLGGCTKLRGGEQRRPHHVIPSGGAIISI
jgi:hypothetical protein